MRDSTLTEHVQALPDQFGATTVVLNVALDDMNRPELYAVIRMLGLLICPQCFERHHG